jgi:hypothetical protein
MAIQEGVIDWFSFWLTGREDPSPKKRDQYARWHEFRTLARLRGFEGERRAKLLIHRGVTPQGLHYTGVAEAA